MGVAQPANDKVSLNAVVDYGKSLVVSGAFAKVTLEEIVHGAGQPLSLIGDAFSTKEELYKLVVETFTHNLLDSICDVSPHGVDTESFLLLYAQNYITRILDRDAMEQYRFAASFVGRRPEIADQFRLRIEEGTNRLAQVLENQTNIIVPDGMSYVDASAQFFALCRGGLHHKMVFTGETRVGAEEIEDHARKAVSTFLRAFPLAA